jgi:hypothetical protein
MATMLNTVSSRELTLKQLRERRERLLTELASLEAAPASAREVLTWRQRLAELEGRIERHSHG